MQPEELLLSQDQITRIVQAAHRHGAGKVRVFGSVSRGMSTGDSDLDLLVEMEAGRDLFDLVALKQDLEESLGHRVDVVAENSLSPHMREAVLSEAVPI